MGDQNPQDFAEKVLQSLKKSSRAVDLNDKPDPEPVQPVTQQSANRDFTAYFNQQEGGGQGPVTGGNKDLVIIPGLGGAASTSVSQINLYWSAPNIPDSTGIDSNVRATIYNFAVNPGVGVTIPVIVFGGYNGTQQYKPTPNYGGGTGVTARIWLNPFRGSLELDYVGFNATSSIAATTDIGFMSYDSTQNKIRVGVGVGAGSAKTVAFTDDITAASGAATTAQNIHMQLAGNAASHSIALSLQATGAGVALSSDAELTYNPSTNILSAGTFSGAHTGNLTGTATTAASVELRAGANAVNHSVVFSLNATGTGVGLSTDTALQYNPNSDTLSSTNFSGALTGNVTGFATTAINLNVNNADAATAHYLHFSPVATGSGVATSSDTALSYNPNTNVLTSPTFSGNLTGGVTGNVTGTATTAASIELRAGANSVNHSVVFSLNATGTGVGLSTDTTLLYNPGTDTLSSTTFSGALSGNAATATTAANLNVVSTTATGSHYLLFSPTSGGSGIAVSIDTTLTYVPSTDTLSVSTITPVTVTNSAALTSGTYLTVKTNASDDSSTSDFFIRGLTSADVSKFSVDANGNLRATTKSFDIPHPTKEGMRLVYGVLEGPEHGVYHRGTVEGKGNLLIELPDYWSELVNEDFSVTLTPHGNYGVHIVDKSLNSFIISLSGNLISKKFKVIKVDYLVHGSRKDAPLIVEQLY